MTSDGTRIIEHQDTRPPQSGRFPLNVAAAYAGMACLGVAAWMGYLAWPARTYTDYAPFLLLGLSASLIIGWLSSGESAGLASAFIVGPMLLVRSTAYQGDGDGLVHLHYFILLMVAIPMWISTAVGGRLPGERLRVCIRQASPRVTAVLIALLIVGTGAFTVSAWPNPYPLIERISQKLEFPRFAKVGETRQGRLLRSSNGGPTIEMVFTTSMSRREACAALREGLAGAGAMNVRRLRPSVGSDCLLSARMSGGPFETLGVWTRTRPPGNDRRYVVGVGCGCAQAEGG